MVMKEILERMVLLLSRGETVAVATILSASGSLPMSRRSKMLIAQDGSAAGTVGGGCLEAEVHALARTAIRTRRPGLRRFTLTEAEAGAEGLNCGGTAEILIEPMEGAGALALHAAALEAIGRRDETVLATLLAGCRSETPSVEGKALVGWKGLRLGWGSLADAGSPGAAAAVEEALSLLGSDRAAVLELDRSSERRLFLETVSAPPTLYLFGGGHVALAVARVARTAGFRVVVIDDRPDFANRERFPEADAALVLPLQSAFEHLAIGPEDHVVAVTRGHQHDEPVIEQALRTKAAYIGMIGSRRKVAILWRRLEARGVSRQELQRVHAPIGLPIGADTPGEIAVSIVAQMVQVRRERPGTGR
ncbi:MAG TPA: XdhC family protein [Candidatus Polarisedimenticolia bacterium]|nr:XdhC family protein [Candidatus Polarisedimenticolia bacterium]